MRQVLAQTGTLDARPGRLESSWKTSTSSKRLLQCSARPSYRLGASSRGLQIRCASTPQTKELQYYDADKEESRKYRRTVSCSVFEPQHSSPAAHLSLRAPSWSDRPLWRHPDNHACGQFFYGRVPCRCSPMRTGSSTGESRRAFSATDMSNATLSWPGDAMALLSWPYLAQEHLPLQAPHHRAP